ncbi:MAG: N-acyl-D-glutamate deacylase [Paenibacillus sp.]|jgi:N-acyl-D-amino-acid deacylase|nr:N-acyl-D-glutamate deacylase [Paenibacillus sp.]
MELDKVIKGGLIVDGTGAAPFKGDIGIIGDEIAAIGNLDGASAKQVIDAEGLVVTPGFIDVHVHSELALLGGPDQYAPLQMGVTTQLASPDGFSWAPLSGNQIVEMKDYLATFYEDDCIDASKPMTIDSLLSIFEGNIPGNLVLQVPHGSVRQAVLDWNTRPATDDEIKQMAALTREWMERGAKAFATGLEYEPMRRADMRELAALSRVTAEYGGIYVAHQRGYGDNVRIGCGETFELGKQANIPVHISHFTVDPAAAEEVERGTKEGVDISFDMYPYGAGSTHLLLKLPPFAQEGNPQEVRRRLTDPSFRKRLTDHIEREFPDDRVRFASVGKPRQDSGEVPAWIREINGWEGKLIGEVRGQVGVSLTDLVCDLIVHTEYPTLVIFHWAEDRLRYLEDTFKHPLHMVSTDGIYAGVSPHPRGFGTYPKIFREYVYDKGWLSLEKAVRNMTAYPAERFSIERRGKLTKGYFADIVAFDPATIRDRATFAQPRQTPIGVQHVLVNGQFAIHNSNVVPGNNGRIVR